jgi:hypothetical protein
MAASTQTLSDAARTAIRSAHAILAPHAGDDRVAGVIGKLGAIVDADSDKGDDLAKAMLHVQELRKSEDLPQDIRDSLEKAGRACELEYLRRSNPNAPDPRADAAERYRQAHGRVPA